MSGTKEYRLDQPGTTIVCGSLEAGDGPPPPEDGELAVIWPAERADALGDHAQPWRILIFREWPGDETTPARGLYLKVRAEDGGSGPVELARFAGQKVAIPDRLREMFESCHREMQRIGGGNGVHRLVHDLWAKLESYIADLAARISALPGRSLEHQLGIFARLESARRLLEHELKTSRCVTRAAERASMSRSHFIRTFKAFYGETPKQVRIARRLEMARRLLRHSSLSVAEISAQTGFGNRCAFHRLFRDRFGETPTQYRQRPR